MGMCKKCSEVFASQDMIDGLCKRCQKPLTEKEINKLAKDKENVQKVEDEILKMLKENASTMFLTTEMSIDKPIEKRLRIVTAQHIQRISLSDQINTIKIEEQIKEANNDVIEKLKVDALSVGANAVIAVRIEYSYDHRKDNDPKDLFVFATGTAVKI